MRSFRRLTPVVAASLLLAGGLAGCGDDDKAAAGKSGLERNGQITVASLPLVDGAALYIAQKQKLFEAEGLKVKIQPVQQSIAAMPALQKGSVDVIAGANYVTFLAANDAGTLKLKILNEGATLTSNMMNVVVPAKSPIKEPKDLEGKTVAVNIPNNIQSLTLNAVLKAKNVDPTKVKYKAVPFPQMATALQKGDIDSAHMVEPFLSAAQKNLGARVVVDGGSDPVKDMPISGYVSTDAFTTKYPKLAAAFQRVMFKAQAQAAGDRKKVEEVLPGYAKITPDVASVITLPGYPTSNNETRLNRIVDLMEANKLLKQKPDLKTLIFTPQS
ncbi:ABC transporter substrate-binding protein [Actinomadura parmotrematis]|uniref:ABC transporter substrate-binding protein n=1 Tax=Actinomadura parmotrematis TaxID=2864039 RepID=A0ABS7FQ03_9ACTN|nr:ABC transporter substrate-binding protein [Actinomadura parmotrematis]MBW8482480.1 ABC transporter substrate-binding protein [Actinomadura parmotrematis]